MAMGREGDRQDDLIVTWAEMPRSPGHVFYDRLQAVLMAGGFDGFVETVSTAAENQATWRRNRPASQHVFSDEGLGERPGMRAHRIAGACQGALARRGQSLCGASA